MNMDATKKLLKNIPEYLLYFLAADLVCSRYSSAEHFTAFTVRSV